MERLRILKKRHPYIYTLVSYLTDLIVYICGLKLTFYLIKQGNGVEMSILISGLSIFSIIYVIWLKLWLGEYEKKERRE